MIQQTSILSYMRKKEEGLGEDQIIVYNALKRLGIATDLEITQHLGYIDPNKVRPRRNELVKMSMVEMVEKRKCNVSGRLAITWRCKK